MKNILLLTLSISALLIPTNLLMGKRNKKAESLPLVDVSVPLHIERNQFGLPIAIGTPLPGPKHGIGSYWYQVGKMWAEADAQDNFAVVVYRYLENAGRLAEFIGDQGESSDIFSRRISMTTAQYEQQLVSELAAGAYPEEIIDFLNGVHQGYINHITKIENGDAPLPADFVTDIGILNWFWAERTTVAPTLFTIPNYIRGLEILNYDFGSSYTSVNQVFFGFLGQLAASEADPSGGVDAVNVLNDINGVPSFNFRYTVKEGDRGGIYCPTMASGLCIQTPDGALRKAKQSHQPRAILPLQKSHLTRLKKELEAKKQRRTIQRHHISDFLVVGKDLTKDSSSLMFGNPQVNTGFDGVRGGSTWDRFSFNTPCGASYSPSFGSAYIRSETGYSLNLALEYTPVATRDALFEDSSRLTLLYDAATNTQNVIGGKDHSRILVRQQEGSISETFITIYQGNVRPGLEADFRLPDPNNSENEFVVITRHPCDWMKEVGGYLKGIATFLGMVPFNSVEQFAENLSTDPLVFMIAGIDNRSTIFTVAKGLYPVITLPDFNRQYPQDATASQFFTTAAARPLPVAHDTDYACRGSLLAKNPSCGFIAGWNNIWSNDDQLGADTAGQDSHRVGSIFKDLSIKVKEKGKLEYQDIRDLWVSSIVLERDGASVFDTLLDYAGSNAFSFVFRDDLFAALHAKGLAVGLTQQEIDRTIQLLGENYDGRSIPNVDITDLLDGTNYDGRWVLSQLWISILHRNLWVAGIPDQTFREAAALAATAFLSITEPTGDWTQSDPFQSRVAGVAISSSAFYSNPMLLRILKIGPDLGNPIFYDWYGNVLSSTGLDLRNKDDRNTFIAQALFDALAFQVTGSNARTGLEDPLTGRANLALIQDDGIPLHPGWGKGQRPITIDGDAPYTTQYLINNFNVRSNIPTANRIGQLQYAERTCNGHLKHFQTVAQLGYSSLLTVNTINGENVITVQPHATDQATYFEGNFQTDEIPIDICLKKKKRKNR